MPLFDKIILVAAICAVVVSTAYWIRKKIKAGKNK